MGVFSFPAITLNIGSDIQVMGAAANLLIPQIPAFAFSILFAAELIFFIDEFPYPKFADVLKWLCVSLLLYVAEYAYFQNESVDNLFSYRIFIYED